MAVISTFVLVSVCLYFLFLSFFMFLHEIMINSKYKPKCKAGNRGTFFYSDFKYPCKKEEEEDEVDDDGIIPEEFYGSELGEGDVGIELQSVVVKDKEPKKYESIDIAPERSVEVHLEGKKKFQIEPCYVPSVQKSENLFARWKQIELQNFNKNVIVCPEPLDSYEKILLQPFCPSWPPTPMPESPSELSYTMKTFGKGSIPRLFCVLCGGDLYENGPLHELHIKTENVKRQSLLKNDKVKKLIGIRTRITVHTICYEEYIKLFVKESHNPESIETESS